MALRTMSCKLVMGESWATAITKGYTATVDIHVSPSTGSKGTVFKVAAWLACALDMDIKVYPSGVPLET